RRRAWHRPCHPSHRPPLGAIGAIGGIVIDFVANREGARMLAGETKPGLVVEERRGCRIGWHSDADADKDVDSSDPWFWFCHDEAWRIVATFRASDADPKEVFVYHNAGLGGFGGSSYIDSVILRDRDATNQGGQDDGLEERRYYCQNWRADVSAVLTDAGSMVEWVKYSPYGVPFALPAGDTDSDGDWDATDSSAITGSYDVRKDVQLDGDVDSADITQANAVTGGYQTLGRGILSSSAVANRKGYAGYEYDPTFEGAGRHLYHVRHRVYDADIGRWTRRDPLGYIDGMCLYQYVRSKPVWGMDPLGLLGAFPCDFDHGGDAISADGGCGSCSRAISSCNTEPPVDPPPPYLECCEEALRQNPGAAAVTICCKGELTVCINDSIWVQL